MACREVLSGQDPARVLPAKEGVCSGTECWSPEKGYLWVMRLPRGPLCLRWAIMTRHFPVSQRQGSRRKGS